MTPEQEEIERLKAQIERLQAGKKRTAEFSVREDNYKGYPILVFEGPTVMKPFSMGVGKLQVIRANWNKVVEFLDKNKDKPNKSSSEVEQI
jgi:prefoldin subunit 5